MGAVHIFGPEGEGFERINIACPRAILVETMERIKLVIELTKSNFSEEEIYEILE